MLVLVALFVQVQTNKRTKLCPSQMNSSAQIHFCTNSMKVNSDSPVTACRHQDGGRLADLLQPDIHHTLLEFKFTIHDNQIYAGELRFASDSLHQDGGRLVDLQPHHPLRPHRHPHIHGHP